MPPPTSYQPLRAWRCGVAPLIVSQVNLLLDALFGVLALNGLVVVLALIRSLHNKN